jgi:membrane-bound lytic murein transglycosylase D
MQRLLVFLLGIFFGITNSYAGTLHGYLGKNLPSDTLIAISANLPTVATDTLIDMSDDAMNGNSGNDLPFDLTGGRIASCNLNSNAIDFISSFYRLNNKSLEIFQSRAAPYLTMISDIFHHYGIPDEMKYLAVIESGLNTNAVSRVGAVGTWQFMASTARLMGLDVTVHRDDRRNFYKSTDAAAKYLSQMHGQLQNWLLVVAAYDCGLGGVMKAINASGTTNFWDLEKYLPEESRKHVLKFIATAYILDRFTAFFGLTVPVPDIPSNLLPPIPDEPLQALTVTGKFCLPIIADRLGIDSIELTTLNPDFNSASAQGSSYTLNLPENRVALFKINEQAILNESVLYLIKHNSTLEIPGNNSSHATGHHRNQIRSRRTSGINSILAGSASTSHHQDG